MRPQEFEYNCFILACPAGKALMEFEVEIQENINSYARDGWRFKTCRRMLESPFTLMILMERTISHHGYRDNNRRK